MMTMRASTGWRSPIRKRLIQFKNRQSRQLGDFVHVFHLGLFNGEWTRILRQNLRCWSDRKMQSLSAIVICFATACARTHFKNFMQMYWHFLESHSERA